MRTLKWLSEIKNHDFQLTHTFTYTHITTGIHDKAVEHEKVRVNIIIMFVFTVQDRKSILILIDLRTGIANKLLLITRLPIQGSRPKKLRAIKSCFFFCFVHVLATIQIKTINISILSMKSTGQRRPKTREMPNINSTFQSKSHYDNLIVSFGNQE